MRLVIVPRWSGTASSDFYPWLRDQVTDAFDEIVTAPLAPAPDAPELAASVERLRPLLDPRARTLVLGHSVGNQVVMHTLAALDGPPVAGCLLVAGWFSIDEPWGSIRPFIEAPLDDDRVRAMAGPMRVLLSSDDRYTKDHQGTRAAFESRLGAQVRVVDDTNHFNAARQPEVLEELFALHMAAGE